MFFPTHFFAEHTSVHGLKYNRNVVDSILWLIPLGLALSICFYEANGTITKFLGFNQKLTVKTKNDTEEQGQSDFPAITFCPKTVFRRSMVGGVGLPLMLVGVNADWGNADEAIQLDKKDICSGDNWIDSYPGPHRVVLSMEIPTYKKGTGPMAKLYMMDSYQSAMDCKYQGITVNCSNLLYNTWSDSGWCFTFNFDMAVIAANFIDNNTEMAYGTDGYILSPRRSIGRKSGFQILIDVKVDEFCYPAFPYVAGFSAIIHDPKTQPLLKFQRQIDLSPGFASNIDITEKRKTMTTESYGYCSSWYNYTLYNPGPNYKGLCAKECLTLEIWHNCGCIPYYSPPLAYYKLMAAPFHMKNVTNSDKYSSGWNRYHRFQFCNVRDGDCVQPIEKMGLGVNGVCVQRCPTPCQESKFVFTMSQSRFPTPNLMNRIKKQLNNSYSLEKARLNLVLANFYFSSTVKKVEQIDIAMTWVDLLGQLGGALGLTIGVSLLSLGEIISWAIWQLVATLTALSKIVCRKNIKWRKPYHL